MPAITELAAGYVFPPVTFTVDADSSRGYRESVGDSLSLYDELGLAPPLAVAAISLGILLEAISLPAGSLHASESVQMHAPVPVGSTLECRSTLAQRSQRSGWIVSVLDSEILHEGRKVLSTRASVLTPLDAA